LNNIRDDVRKLEADQRKRKETDEAAIRTISEKLSNERERAKEFARAVAAERRQRQEAECKVRELTSKLDNELKRAEESAGVAATEAVCKVGQLTTEVENERGRAEESVSLTNSEIRQRQEANELETGKERSEESVGILAEKKIQLQELEWKSEHEHETTERLRLAVSVAFEAQIREFHQQMQQQQQTTGQLVTSDEMKQVKDWMQQLLTAMTPKQTESESCEGNNDFVGLLYFIQLQSTILSKVINSSSFFSILSWYAAIEKCRNVWYVQTMQPTMQLQNYIKTFLFPVYFSNALRTMKANPALSLTEIVIHPP